MSSDYTIYLADNALILGHRNSEWCGHGPVLEQDIAITNISLDLIGQARNFYQLAALQLGNGQTEDSLAYVRDIRDFKNCLISELPKGDWGFTCLRQFFFSNYQHLLFREMSQLAGSELAPIAEKALKEVSYHLRWSSEWVIRLGDGTEESKERMQQALVELWPYTGELFQPAAYEDVSTTGIDLSSLYKPWLHETKLVMQEAGLSLPATGWMQSGGKTGTHTEYMGLVLAELQFVQRAYPNSQW